MDRTRLRSVRSPRWRVTLLTSANPHTRRVLLSRTTRVAGLLACLVMTACSSTPGAPDAHLGRLESRVVFGADDRKDVYQLVDEGAVDLVAMSRAVGMLVDTSVVASDGARRLACSAAPAATLCTAACQRCDILWGTDYAASARQCVPDLAACPDLCPDEPFRDQLSVGHCTGFLVGPDLFATAGHCLANVPCSNTAIVFGYEVRRAADGTPTPNERGLDTYHCAEVVAAEHGAASTPDWALLRLDRPALDRVPLCLERSATPAQGASLVLMGFPMGLPLKTDSGGKVSQVDQDGLHFEMTTDSYSGNSGSAVLDAANGHVIGVLTRGPTYAFAVSPGETCSRSRVCDDDGGCAGAFPTALRSERFASLVPSTTCYAQGKTCGDASACSTGCDCADGICAQGLQCMINYCDQTQCAASACRTATCSNVDGCSAEAKTDCAACGSAAQHCIGGRCGDPAVDGFEDGMADYWTETVDDPDAGLLDWFIVGDRAASGTNSLRTPPNGTWSERTLARSVVTRGGAAVSFAFRIDADGSDRLIFAVDGAPQATFYGGTTATWSSFQFPARPEDGYLQAGAHTLVWRFDRSGGAAVGENAVWLDDVKVTHLKPACGCAADADCDDAVTCDGHERCVSGTCVDGTSTCVTGFVCDAQYDACVECVVDVDCGAHASCIARSCVTCASDADCVDGNLCNGAEQCVAGKCKAGQPLICSSTTLCGVTARCDPSVGCVGSSTECPAARSAADAGLKASVRDSGFPDSGPPAAKSTVIRVRTCACTVVGRRLPASRDGMFGLFPAIVLVYRRFRAARRTRVAQRHV